MPKNNSASFLTKLAASPSNTVVNSGVALGPYTTPASPEYQSISGNAGAQHVSTAPPPNNVSIGLTHPNSPVSTISKQMTGNTNPFAISSPQPSSRESDMAAKNQDMTRTQNHSLVTGNSGQLPTGTVSAEQTPFLDNLTTGSGVTGIMDGYRQSIGESPAVATTAPATASNAPRTYTKADLAKFRRETGTNFNPLSTQDRHNMSSIRGYGGSQSTKEFAQVGRNTREAAMPAYMAKSASARFLTKIAEDTMATNLGRRFGSALGRAGDNMWNKGKAAAGGVANAVMAPFQFMNAALGGAPEDFGPRRQPTMDAPAKPFTAASISNPGSVATSIVNNANSAIKGNYVAPVTQAPVAPPNVINHSQSMLSAKPQPQYPNQAAVEAVEARAANPVTPVASAQNPIVHSGEMNGPTDWGAIFHKQTGTAFDPNSKMDRLNMQRLQNQQSTYNRRQYGYGGNVKTSSVGFLMKLAAGLYVPTTGGYPSATGVMTGAVQLPGIETTPAAPWTTTSATGKINAAGNAGSGAVSTLSNPTRGRNQSAFDGGSHITSRDAVSSIYGGSRLGTTSAKIHKWLAPLLKRYPGRAGLLGLLGLGGVGGMGYGLKNLMGDKEEVAKGVGMGMQRGSLGAMTGMRDYLGNQGFMDRLFNGKTLSGLDQIIAGMQGGGVKTSSAVASLRNHLETLLVDKLATEIEEDLPEKYRNRRSLANLLSGAGAGALAGGVMGHASGGSALGGAGAGALIGGGLGYGMNKLRNSIGLDEGSNDLNAAAVDPETAEKLHRRRQLAVLLPLLLGGATVGGVAGAAGSEDGSRLAGGSMGALLGALAGGTAGATRLGMSGLMGLDPVTGGVAHYARPKTS